MSGIRTHAMERARERYGIELTFNDILQMSRRCAKGEGRTETTESGTTHHTLIVGDRVLWVIYKHAALVGNADGRILTVLPAGAAIGRAIRDVQHMNRRNGNGGSFKFKRAWR